MKKNWILFEPDTRRTFSKATWIPLRASCDDKNGTPDQLGFTCDNFFCGSVAFPPEHRKQAESLSWTDIGIGHSVGPYAYEDGFYEKIVDNFDNKPDGVYESGEKVSDYYTINDGRSELGRRKPSLVEGDKKLYLKTSSYNSC